MGTINVPNFQGSATGTLVILPLKPANQVVAAGGTLTLNVTLAGDPSLAYQWFKDGRRLLGVTNSTLTVPNASIANSGSYYVVVTNGSKMMISVPATVAVGNPTLLAWGWNAYGQLGNGTTNDANLPVTVASNVVAVAAGSEHSLFVTSDGVLWTMGSGGFGQLGNGNFTQIQATPTSIANNVVAVAAGSGHSLFVKADGTLWAMGWNNFYQLGNGDITRNAQPSPVLIANNVVTAVAGFNYSLFLKTDGTLWAMGNGTYLTPVSVASNVVAVAGGTSQFAVCHDGRNLVDFGNHAGYWGDQRGGGGDGSRTIVVRDDGRDVVGDGG